MLYCLRTDAYYGLASYHAGAGLLHGEPSGARKYSTVPDALIARDGLPDPSIWRIERLDPETFAVTGVVDLPEAER